MSKQNKIIYPEWMDTKISSNSSDYRGVDYVPPTTYREAFEFLGMEKSINSMFRYYQYTDDVSINDIFNMSMVVKDYDSDVHHEGVEYPEERLTAKGKPYVDDLPMIRRANDEHFRKPWKYAEKFFSGTSLNRTSECGSPLDILGNIAYDMTILKEEYEKKKRELLDPIFLQRADVGWFIERNSEDYFFYGYMIQYAEGVRNYSGQGINHLYSTVYSLLGAKGKKIESLSHYGIKGNRTLEYNYLYKLPLNSDDYTLWDFIKAVIKAYFELAKEAKFQMLEVQDNLASGYTHRSTCQTSNFFETMKARAKGKALKECLKGITSFSYGEDEEKKKYRLEV